MKKLLSVAAMFIGVLAAGTGQACAQQLITFDEFPPTNNNVPLTNTHLGATFGGDNAGTWAGLSNGDPGHWGLEGTSGPNFLLFDGIGPTGGYSDTVTFAVQEDFVAFDASRANGSIDGTITLEAFRGTLFLGSDSAVLGSINTWSELSFGAFNGFTSIEIVGDGTGYHPFGIDGLYFIPEPSTWTMMLAGFAGLGFAGYRRAARASRARLPA